jgi:GTP pyrophosphokinase
MLRQYELVERVAYAPQADEAMLNRAYVYTVRNTGRRSAPVGIPISPTRWKWPG